MLVRASCCDVTLQIPQPSLRLRSLARSFRRSRTRIRMLSRPQHDIGIETAQPQAPRLQLVNRIQIETPERPLHIRLQRLHEPRFDHKSNLFRFTVCGFELICATSIIG